MLTGNSERGALKSPLSRWPYWLPFAVALVAFGAYAFLWRDGPISANDSPSYLEAARDLEDFDFDRSHLRSVGYPLLLRLTGNGRDPGPSLVLAQLLLHFGALSALAGLLARVRTRPAFVVAFVVAGSLPHIVQGAAMVLSESLTGSLLALGMTFFGCALVSASRLIPGMLASGLLLAACGATRPIYLAVPLALGGLVILLVWSKSAATPRVPFRTAAALVAPTLLLVASSWAVRSDPSVATSPLLEFALFAKMANYVDDVAEEQSELRAILVRHRDRELLENRHHRAEGFIFKAWDEVVELAGGDERRARAALREAATTLISSDPSRYLRLVWNSVPRYWSWYSAGVPGLRQPATTLFSTTVHFATVAVFAISLALVPIVWLLWGALAQPTRNELTEQLALGRRATTVLLAMLIAVLLPALVQTTLGVGAPRYRLPTDPLILFLSVASVDRLLRFRRFLGERTWR